MKIAFVGCGKLGKAFVRALLNKGVSSKDELLAFEREESGRSEISAALGIPALAKVDLSIRQYDVILFAVKPQDFSGAAQELSQHIAQRQLLLSVMTGITMQRISESLHGHTQIIRSMPNLPAQIGMSITPFACHPKLDSQHRSQAMKILSAIGEHMELENEELLNAVTALSATGPGYVYEVISHMIAAAKEMGFSQEQAAKLISQTFLGSIELWLAGTKSVEELRSQIKTKGGTTEAALNRFAAGDLGTTLRDGILAAYKRAIELGKG